MRGSSSEYLGLRLRAHERLHDVPLYDVSVVDLPGTPDGSFLVLYQFPGEALRETLNATVHGFICTALVSTAS
jgi:hypothetical protein